MTNINPVSENFFYWDPEQLVHYQATERNAATALSSLVTSLAVDTDLKKRQGMNHRSTEFEITSPVEYVDLK